MRKICKVIFILFFLVSYPILVLVWHPWQMEKDLSMVLIPVAKQNLIYRTEITEKDLDYLKLPKAFVKEDMILNQEELIGKVVSHSYQIAKGSVFTSEMIEEKERVKDKAIYALEKGQAALNINVEAMPTLGNGLQVNQKIDLYCIIQNRNETPIVDLLLKSVRIIDIRDRKGLELDDPQGTGTASIITLAVNQDYISLLTTASYLGTWQIVVNEQSWERGKECILNKESKVYPYLISQEMDE